MESGRVRGPTRKRADKKRKIASSVSADERQREQDSSSIFAFAFFFVYAFVRKLVKGISGLVVSGTEWFCRQPFMSPMRTSDNKVNHGNGKRQRRRRRRSIRLARRQLRRRREKSQSEKPSEGASTLWLVMMSMLMAALSCAFALFTSGFELLIASIIVYRYKRRRRCRDPKRLPRALVHRLRCPAMRRRTQIRTPFRFRQRHRRCRRASVDRLKRPTLVMRSVIVALLLLTTALGFCQSPFIRLDAGLVLSLLLFCLLTFPTLPSPPRVSTLVPLSWFFSLTPPPTVSKQLPLTKNKHKVLPDVSADAQSAFRDPEFFPVQATCDEGESVCISDALLADFNVGNLSFVNIPPPESCVSSADWSPAFSRSPVVGQSLIVTVPWSGGEPSPSQPAVSSAAPALPRDVLTAVDLFPRAVSVGISAFNSFQTLGESELESPTVLSFESPRRTATSPLPSPSPPSTTVPPPAVPQPRSLLSVLAAPLGSRGDVEAAEAPLLALPAAVEVVGDGGDICGLPENGKGVSTANRLDDWIENGGIPALLDSCNVTDNGVDDIGLLRARVLVDHLLPSFIAAMAFYLEIVVLPSLWYIAIGSVMRMEIILVLLMNKSETRMDFYPWTTVGDLKMRIEEKSGFGRQWQRLLGNGEVLSDEGKLLSSYDINNGSTIHVVLTLRGTYIFYFTLHHLLTFFFLRCTGGGDGDDENGSSTPTSVEKIESQAYSEKAFRTPPPREKTGLSPAQKKKKKEILDASRDASDRVQEALADLMTQVAKLDAMDADAQGGSPSSTISTVSEEATEVEEMTTKMKHVRKRLDDEYLKSTDEEATQRAEKEQNCVNTATEIDGSSLLLFDDPHQWDEKIRKIYQKHRQHNIASVRDRLMDDKRVPISKKQRGDYFSRAALGIAIAHYPPSSQCGEKTNVAIEVHRKATQKNDGNQILRLKSSCMQTHARFVAGAMGVVDFVEKDDKYAYDYVEYYDDAGVQRNARVTMSTITFLQHDFIDRHPTFDDNKVNVEKIIDSKLGMDYRIQGDDLFADLIKYRRAFILTRSANSMGSPTKAPVIVWNAGRVKCDSERTGAQAPMVETFVQKGIDEQLFGIFHPEYLMWRENPVVQVAAEETDLEICRFIEASGSEVRDGDVVRKYVGVAECTPEERDRMARELHETMSALGMLAWISKGRPESEKNKYYLEYFEKTGDEELSAKLAQQLVMFDGALEAAMRFAGLTAEKVAELDEEGVKDLIEAHRYDGLLRAAARFQNISWADVQGMMQNEIDDMVRTYIRAGQLAAAAKYFDISDKELREMTKQQKDELIANHIRVTSRAGQAVAAAKHFNKELKGMTEAEKDELVKDHKRETSRVGQEVAAAKFFSISEQDLAIMDDTQKKNVIIAHIRKSTIEAAAKKKNIDRNSLAQMTKKQLDELINDHKFCGKVEAAISWARKQKPIDTSPSTSLSIVASTATQQQQSTAVDRFLKLADGELANMDGAAKNELLKDLVAEHNHFSRLKKACVTFGEDFDKVKGESWTPQDRRDLIERSKLLSRAESLGYSSKDVRGMTQEERRQVKHIYRKGLLLSKLGIEAGDGDENDGADDVKATTGKLTYEEAMEMTIEEIQTLIVKREGGKTTQQAMRETFALSLGLPQETITGLSEKDLDKIRVIRLQKGRQKKNIERGVFHLPGTRGHANMVEDICSGLRAYGLLILSEQIETKKAQFLNDWAFRVSYEHDVDKVTLRYKVYRRAAFQGVEYFERLLDDVLCTGAKKTWSTKTSATSLAAIPRYIYHKRGTFFKDTILPTTLGTLRPKDMDANQLGQRIHLQKKIEQNKDGSFKFADDEFFTKLLDKLATESKVVATFHSSLDKNKDERPWWYTRVCFQRTTAPSGKQTDNMYYQDDSGSWLGPSIQWNIVPGVMEKRKQTHVAIVEILNALDNKFKNVLVANDGGEEEESDEEEDVQY